MITIRELTKNPARDIVEGRKKLIPVETVPLVDFKAPLARVPENVVPILDCYPRGGTTLRSAMRAYRETSPGDFTTTQAAAFIKSVGWTGANPRSCVLNHMNLLARDGMAFVNGVSNWRFA